MREAGLSNRFWCVRCVKLKSRKISQCTVVKLDKKMGIGKKEAFCVPDSYEADSIRCIRQLFLIKHRPFLRSAIAQLKYGRKYGCTRILARVHNTED